MVPGVERRERQATARRAGERPPLARAARRALPVLIAVAALVGLVLAVNPRALAGALTRFHPLAVPAIAALAAAWYVLQGVRWHHLLRAAGSRLRMRDSVLLSVAGQVITAVLPLGDLTRAIFAAEGAGIEFGAAAATVTVQELVFILLLVLLATPGMLALHLGTGIVSSVIVGVLAVFAILTIPQLFRLVRGAAALLPLPHQLLGQIDALQRETVTLLRRSDTLGWSALDLARAATGATILWVILESLSPGASGWWEAAFVVAVAYVGGALSFLPGGTGASDASVVGLLVLLGFDPGTAGAAALLQRATMTGSATLFGIGAYLVARRRFRLAGLVRRPRS